jgi:dTDP-4-dehydrorhamnose 3,5-epimerase
MKFTECEIEGVWVVSFKKNEDARGSLFEFYNENSMKDLPLQFQASQITVSASKKNVIRGLHYRSNGPTQNKLITCIEGAVSDVVVDIRPKSPSFGKFKFFDLDGADDLGILISSGLAHGFQATKDNSVICYGLTATYDPIMESAIHPLDIDLNLPWPDKHNIVLSEKDKNSKSLKDYLKLQVK